ncbi:MAG: tRNA (guanosine(37)-N1)-methyltransferase TrmD [Pseudomonadota bacterium]
MQIYILSILPELFAGFLDYGVIAKSFKKNICHCEIIDIRKFGIGKNNFTKVDDSPYGGGAGMVMRPDVLGAAIDHVINLSKKKCDEMPEIFYMSPKGSQFTQKLAQEFSKLKNIIIICGRFEGIDERILREYKITEISVGDYILTGGEIAAMVMSDAIIRLIPNVLGSEDSLQEESFNIDNRSLLEYPLYTKPKIWRDKEVPDILLSGDHQAIKDWRLQQASDITKNRRKDLLDD